MARRTEPFRTYEEVLETIDETGVPRRRLGRAPDGSPIVAAEAGGDAEPSIVITAGAHATEQAGVSAAVDLIERLETDHRVYVVPSRDPVGLTGYEHALELATGGDVAVETRADVRELLRSEGETVYRDDEFVVSLIGEYGFATREPTEVGVPVLDTLKEFTETNPDVLEPLRGRRIFTASNHTTVEGAEGLKRAYTLVVDPSGTPLHLNRFFTTPWAAAESRCVRQLMEEVEPALTFDCHETSRQEDRYHISLRPQGTEEGDERERRVAAAITEDLTDRGVTLATDEDVMGEPTKTVGYESDRESVSFYSRAGEGAYWVDPNATSPPRLGEGLNATDYAADRFGLAFTLETGMLGAFEDRVEAAVRSVQAGVRAFEDLD